MNKTYIIIFVLVGLAMGAWLYLENADVMLTNTSVPGSNNKNKTTDNYLETLKDAPSESNSKNKTTDNYSETLRDAPENGEVAPPDRLKSLNQSPLNRQNLDSKRTTHKSSFLPKPKPPSFQHFRYNDGIAVIAGRSEANSELELTLDGEIIAVGKADLNGDWVIILDKKLPSGSLHLELVSRLNNGIEVRGDDFLTIVIPESQQKIAQGNSDISTEENDIDRLKRNRESSLAIVVPKKIGDTKLLQKPKSDKGSTKLGFSLDKVDYDERGRVVISGTVKPDGHVRVYVDNDSIGDGIVSEEGYWVLRPAQLISEGLHVIRADNLSADGSVIARLELPFDRTPLDVLLSLPESHRVVVQPGNSLWRIARRLYGQGAQYTVIYKANNHQIRNPNLIYPGQVFGLPKLDEKRPSG